MLGPAASASATDYFAAPAPGAPATGSCADGANPCTIDHALSLAGGSGDRILLAAGTYVNGPDTPMDIYREVSVMGARHDGLTIQGAGSGTDPATNTIFRPANKGSQFLTTNAFLIGSADVTLRGVRIDTSVANDPNNGGVLIFGSTRR